MELNRRNFIKFLVGGAAGIHLTPLPWKLMDDSAIWTQNWSWVPVPPVGEFTHAPTVCTLCPGGCGIEVRKVDERAVKIEGRTDYPVNPGGICPVGMGGLHLLYNEAIRFTRPMKRVGPRGAGRFAEIGWDEALDLLAGRISELRQAGRPEALAAVDGNPLGTTQAVMIERLLAAVGSPNYVRPPSIDDTYRMGNLLMQGAAAPMAYDLENADYILSFGCGLLEGWGAPGRVLHAWGLWHDTSKKRSTQIVQVEPRASNTASKADRWVAARPGTEAALALGMAHVMIKESLFDDTFVNNHCFGFTDYRSGDGSLRKGFRSAVMENYGPEQVAGITGLAAEEIRSLARDFAKATAPLAIYGRGKGRLNGSLYEWMAVQSLNALKGNINRPGGPLVHDPLPLSALPAVAGDAISRQGLQKARIDGAGGPAYPFTHSLIHNLSKAILDAPTSPVDTLLVFSANPAFTMPDGGAFQQALKKVPFIASFSPYRDETAVMADLILPDHTFLEKQEDVVWPTGLQYPLYGLSNAVVAPLYDTRHTGDVIIQLADAMGGPVKEAFPWDNFEAVLKARTRGLFDAGNGALVFSGDRPPWEQMRGISGGEKGYDSFDDMFGKLAAGGLWYQTAHAQGVRPYLFKTPTGKFEFSSSKIEYALRNAPAAEAGDAAMAHYIPPASEGDSSAYPLIMVPYEMINVASGFIPTPPFLKKTLFDDQLYKDDSFVEINPKTAAEYGLKQGDRVIVQSPAGSVQVRVNLFAGAMPGTVNLPLGFGHTAYGDFLKGKGANPNRVVRAGMEPLSGHPVWWNRQAKLIKV